MIFKFRHFMISIHTLGDESTYCEISVSDGDRENYKNASAN